VQPVLFSPAPTLRRNDFGPLVVLLIVALALIALGGYCIFKNDSLDLSTNLTLARINGHVGCLTAHR
jgi:hypothetical protein